MRILIGSVVLSLLFSSLAFAGWDKKPLFRWEQLYHYDLRDDNHDLYTNRVSATFDYLGSEKNELFSLTAFYENRRNINKGFTQRNFFGLEIGKDIFSWLYLGEAVQYGLMKEDYLERQDFVTRYYTEAETRLMLNCSLISSKYLNIKGFILDEYTYDIRRNARVRNETTAGLLMPVGKYIEAGVNWRHIDRIRHYDSDTFEATVTLIF